MAVSCVRVPVDDGEATRQRLADADLIDDTHAIAAADGALHIPVTDAAAVPDALSVVSFDAPPRRTQTTPADILGFDPSYARLGDIVIVDEDDSDRAHAIADAVVESDIPVEAVLNRASKIKGEQRVREWDVIAGDSTETVHREYGHAFALDVAAVYFSPRLATERHRVVEQVTAGEHVFDMFAGVGPYAVPMASAGARVVATDVNETAIDYLQANAARNGVADRVTGVAGDVREVAGEYTGWADRIVMNLPHTADEFLETAVALAGDECTLHFYDIQHEDGRFDAGEAAIRAAARPAYDVTVATRHTVRSYAPHEFNVVLDVSLSRR
ncbi:MULTISPECIES: class I SAM-dependent methyltransferase [Halobacterium]|uniref:class I SAM-dependent methyltransferase n=1 Tax=Halobacterium TaxID=2239 RepID=UPI00196239CA|nr:MULTISPECIES: class I SAM-dependent methyltransferase family protein [Halobacterium]MDL0145422.1 class I SAM-dependent methyltransferase family protein [Halobacterium salinarum]QRY23546.1 class I SAM-dependent methyltransferase family protein [Halobacterium sp. GSL-19]